MTKTVLTSYTTLLCMGLLIASTSLALASEVTGTLSSNSTSTENADTSNGSVSGTVTSERGSGGSSSRGGSSRTGGSISSNEPTGAVLGQSTDNLSTPGFPNAGTNPEVSSVEQPLWSTVVNFFKNLLPF